MSCDSDEAITSVRVKSGQYLDRIDSFRCTKLKDIAKGEDTGRAIDTVSVGGHGGGWGTLKCPAGSAIVGVATNQGSWIDNVQFKCQDIHSKELKTTAKAGNPTRDANTNYMCEDGQYVNSFEKTRGGLYVDRININCYDGLKVPADILYENKDPTCQTRPEICNKHAYDYCLKPGNEIERDDANEKYCACIRSVSAKLGKPECIDPNCRDNPYSFKMHVDQECPPLTIVNCEQQLNLSDAEKASLKQVSFQSNCGGPSGTKVPNGATPLGEAFDPLPDNEEKGGTEAEPEAQAENDPKEIASAIAAKVDTSPKVVIGAAVGGVALILLIIVIVVVRRRKRTAQ